MASTDTQSTSLPVAQAAPGTPAEMDKRFDPQSYEAKWQQRWAEMGLFPESWVKTWEHWLEKRSCRT